MKKKIVSAYKDKAAYNANCTPHIMVTYFFSCMACSSDKTTRPICLEIFGSLSVWKKQQALIVCQSFSQAFWASCDDLTIHFPEGASSIIVNKHSLTGQVFTEAQFRGASVNLNPGRRYENLEQMGLTDPVKSFRKAPSGPGFLCL